MAHPLGIRAFDSYEDMAAEVEALDVCLPPEGQVPVAMDAAARGLHLMLEKPLAPDLDGARRLRDACRERGVVSQLMLTRRFHPYTQAFLVRVSEEIGEVDGVSAHYVHGAFLDPVFATPWRLRAGVLMDLGPHLFDLLEQVAGPAVEVLASRNDRGAVAITLRHRAGAVSSAMLSGRAAGRGAQRLLVFGTAGKLDFDAVHTDENVALWAAFAGFAHAVRTGGETLVDCARGAELQAVLAAVEKSLASGRRAAVPVA
jgi:predicted dehydrogenase